MKTAVHRAIFEKVLPTPGPMSCSKRRIYQAKPVKTMRSRGTKISEAFKVQFRTEFFNILNHANFTPPLPFFGASNAQIFNADGTQSGGGAVSNRWRRGPGSFSLRSRRFGKPTLPNGAVRSLRTAYRKTAMPLREYDPERSGGGESRRHSPWIAPEPQSLFSLSELRDDDEVQAKS